MSPTRCVSWLIQWVASVIIITVYLHYFLPIVAVILLGYAYFAMFYRASAREVKRLDSILRSLLYSHFGERYVSRSFNKLLPSHQSYPTFQPLGFVNDTCLQCHQTL